MTDQSVMLIKGWDMSIIVSLKSSSLKENVLHVALLMDTAGGILQIGGANSYVTLRIQDSQKVMRQYQDKVRGGS